MPSITKTMNPSQDPECLAACGLAAAAPVPSQAPAGSYVSGAGK